MIEVVNVKSYKGEMVYVGRKMGDRVGSVLGNPFRIGVDGDRDQVIEKYKTWLRNEYRKGGVVKIELDMLARKYKRGEKIVLGCWCKPMNCHGDFIKEAVEKIAATM